MRKLTCVLLIDDDPITNYVNKRMLESIALTDEVLTASNGNEAIELLKQRASSGAFPELILLDVNMPVMGGAEFIEHYKQLNVENKDATKVVVLTTSTHPRDLVHFKDLPTNSYMVKPLTKEKLLGIFDQYFNA